MADEIKSPTKKPAKEVILRNMGISTYSRYVPSLEQVLTLNCGQASVVSRAFATAVTNDHGSYMETIELDEFPEADRALLDRYIELCGKYSVFPLILDTEKIEVTEEVKRTSLALLVEVAEANAPLPEDED